jgi:hypothetical protein
MSKLNTKTLLDNTQTLIQDSSTGLRSRLLVWLNKVLQAVALARDWEFLKKSAAIAIVENTVLLPADFHSFVALVGDDFCLTERHRLTEEEVFAFTDPNAVAPVPIGFTQTAANLILYPGGAGTATLKYAQSVPNYADSTAETVFPLRFGNAIERRLLSLYYEYDMDERAPLSYQLEAAELSALKAWDNRQRPIPKTGRYLRTHA